MKRTAAIVVLLALPLTSVAAEPVPLPPAPEGQTWKLVWQDEFDGNKLDESKWDVPDHKRRDGWWSPKHTPFGGVNQLELIERILEGVPLLRFHLDSGHAKLERGYDRWDEYIDRLGSKLAHVHLSDNDGSADQHLPLGSIPRSTTDWPKHIRKLKASGYDRIITLEVFAPEREHLLLSRDLLRKWWEPT